MCGIVGYSGERIASDIILDSLIKLEYRGYDSVGVAIVNHEIVIYKEKGQVSLLRDSVPFINGYTGIGHTRWATCGEPSSRNAHPFSSMDGRIALVHNGIIENYIPLRQQLTEEGYIFSSQTDTEVLVHLVSKYMQGDLHAALMRALQDVRGTYAIAAVEFGSDRIVVARKENPLVIGVGLGENFIASDVTAILEYTSDVIYIMDGESAVISPDSIHLFSSDGQEIEREINRITWTSEDAKKEGFEHYMLKEIYEQPKTVRDTLVCYLDELETGDLLAGCRPSSVTIVACGTSYHAGLVGKYAIEELANIPVTVELGSEFRYSSGTEGEPMVILITQSGETADTLAACREARRRGCHTVAITNVLGSTITREADSIIMTKAGPEISVAATKTYTAQLISLYLIAVRLALNRETMDDAGLKDIKSQLRSLPTLIERVLDRSDSIRDASTMIVDARHAFFIGRNINYPSMLEGALKLKEISYIHAEGYAAGELKHGPLALLDHDTPLIAACLKNHTYDKMVSNVTEVSARGSPVLIVATDGDEQVRYLADRVIYLPPISTLLSPVLLAITLQLLAYHVAKAKGMPIDKPRNLAKSVTVE